jgi:hypothetical protein
MARDVGGQQLARRQRGLASGEREGVFVHTTMGSSRRSREKSRPLAAQRGATHPSTEAVDTALADNRRRGTGR